MKKFLILTFLFLLPTQVFAKEKGRMWTTASGATSSVVWVKGSSIGEERIRFRSGFKNFRMRMNLLSRENQKYKYTTGKFQNVEGNVEDLTNKKSDSPEMAIVENSRRYALLIGVNTYNKPIHSLMYSVNDMETLSECFRKIGIPKENIFLMTDDSKPEWRPTRQNIERQIESITQLMTPDDQLTIVFNGHGIVIDGKSYFGPSDMELENAATAISRSWAFEQLDKCKARQKIFIVDTNGFTTQEEAKTYSFILLETCGKNQYSWVDEKLKHGIFFHFLAQGLSGEAKDPNGYISILTLFNYASDKTQKYVKQQFNLLQEPTIQFGSKMTDIVFAKIETSEMAPEAVPQTSPEDVPVPLNDQFKYEVSGDSVTITQLLDREAVSVTIPDNVTNIEGKAFGYCEKLTEITVSEGNRHFKSVDGILFSADGKTLLQVPEGKDLTQYSIPDSVTNIGEWAFADCDSLTSVTIPDSVTNIEEGAFSWCDSLTSVTIPDSVTNIESKAFGYCEKLTEIKVSEGNRHFKSVDGILFSADGKTLLQVPEGKEFTQYSIPDSVTNIGKKAFSQCQSLKSVTIPDSVTNIGEEAFSRCDSLTSVTIPDSVTNIGSGAFGYCEKLTEIKVSAGNRHFKSVDGILFTADGKTLIQVPAGKGLTQYSIPDTVTNIGEEAFANCKSLTSVTIPDSVTTIGEYAFLLCENLESVTIPDSVTTIGIGTFHWCQSLKSVTIPDSVTNIGTFAFFACCLESVTIPDSVTNIGTYAFGYSLLYTKLEHFTIYGKAGSEAERYANEEGFKFRERYAK